MALVTETSLSPTVDLPLLAFKARVATNWIKRDLLILFGQEPSTSYTPAQAAICLGRPPRAVAVEMQDLSLLGILRQEQGEGESAYSLTATPRLRNLTIRFASDRAWRPAPRQRFTA